MDSLTTTYVIIAAACAIGLSLFAIWILAPAWTSYGRTWERLAAAVLSVFVLVAFVGTGVGVGLWIVYDWDQIVGVFSALSAPL
jgi:hypothetical protein